VDANVNTADDLSTSATKFCELWYSNPESCRHVCAGRATRWDLRQAFLVIINSATFQKHSENVEMLHVRHESESNAASVVVAAEFSP